MTDRPSNPTDEQPDAENGGWQKPRQPKIWHEVTPETEPRAAWKQKALPTDDEVPEGWHLPSPEDTRFKPEDEIEISKPAPSPARPAEAPPSPEDMIAEIIGKGSRRTTPDAQRPEDMTFGKSAQPTAEAAEAADEVAALPFIDAEEEDDEFFSVSELMALQSLQGAEDDKGTGVLGAEDVASLSPAERAVMQAGASTQGDAQAEGESAADYAARMAAKLASESADSSIQAEGESAADYAARMAASLTTPPPSDTPALSPEQRELAERFRQTRKVARALHARYQHGEITRDELQTQLQQHTLLDPQQNWWMIGLESDQWYRYNSGRSEWEEATPPVPLDDAASAAVNTADILTGSLPYLPSESPTEFTSTSGSGYEISAAGFQIPGQNVPVQDPEATLVGHNIGLDSLDYGTETTIPGMSRMEATMASPSVPAGDYGIASAYDASIPEEYSPAQTFDQIRARERRSTQRMLITSLLLLVGCGLIFAIMSVGGIALWYNSQVDPWRDDILALANYEPEFRTARIYDANNELIIELNSLEGGARTPVSLEDISPYMIHATVSLENPRFYDDPGFDPLAIARAFVQNFTAGAVESGASTITQQIARNLVLRDSEISAARKINEILVSMEIARQYSKNEILQLYLNEIFFGNQSYGIEAASQFYFNKSATDLNMAEAAMLAGLPNAPAANDPVVNRDQAQFMTRNVIRRMNEVGCIQFQHGDWPGRGPFCIGDDVRIDYEGEQARLMTINGDGTYGGVLAIWLAQVETRDYRPREAEFNHPHFVNFIQGQVEAMFGQNTMFQRGFNIYTTLLPSMQDVAEAALQERVNQLVDNGVNTGAVMVTDPRTGAIRAMVGSPDFGNEEIAGQVDNTRTWQQPGSSIKPITYTAAIAGVNGEYLTPSSILWDVPSTYNINGSVYNPVNYDRRFHGPSPVRLALQNSYNVAAVKAYEFVGQEAFVDMATRLGLKFLPEAVFGLPSAVGANEVRLIDMMQAYGTLANGGQRVSLYAIERITETDPTGSGAELDVPLDMRPEPEQAVSPQVAYVMQNILSDDSARAEQFGTNGSLTLARLGIPTQNTVAAKTGTSNDSRDLWAMGFTSNAVVGVWLGTYDNQPTFGTSGYTAAAPVWNRVMEAAVAGRPPQTFQNPGGVVVIDVCRNTGTQLGQDCPNPTRDLSIQNQLPPPASQGFVQNIAIHTWSGMIANEWCAEDIETQTFANIGDNFAVDWLNNTSQGQQYAQQVSLPLPLRAAPQQACQQGMALPNVRVNMPADNETLTGLVTISGQISAADLQSWALEFSPAGTDAYQPITSGTQQFPTAGSTLASWDTSRVPNGPYTLRLSAVSNQGGSITRQITVNLSNVMPTPTPPPTPIPALPATPLPMEATPLPFEPVNPTPTATIDPLA